MERGGTDRDRKRERERLCVTVREILREGKRRTEREG